MYVCTVYCTMLQFMVFASSARVHEVGSTLNFSSARTSRRSNNCATMYAALDVILGHERSSFTSIALPSGSMAHHSYQLRVSIFEIFLPPTLSAYHSVRARKSCAISESVPSYLK
ncbi:hypothetical protein BDN71DRAFT_696842 [Pleurotus eryngii]|uniref:Secreted protein n=1 Tax=Pleurotus eryngii TaxID=5323 RepID=A0A9P6DDZ7_PLEER|nr:hypothetical protein BDN71DRAFT_696842 [Pleurotus eryngii]